ncbi:MAG: Gfo/Idh/MocA family oxidoreductase [Lachnospiraceae bacterium]|nr:Gfo/Idh/MocA family oxidoreductase [Lachnospiraceae bacterium]MDD7148832.1 Gfo/Idh/MocA family oxidoreductase [Lachnospiraceae bacterium]MDY4068319.1 Gfo/Idh/MocA family oxidoreductase [Lachnospiraceae bacterium]
MKIGILGAGGIARVMAETVNGMEEAQCYAVAARDLGRAQKFAEEFGVEKAYGSYEEMLQDPQVELVYIATPHSHHYEHVKLCLEHGKHVLCEKAFTANAAQAEEILKMAEEKGLLLTEAIWTRYMPMRKTIDEVVASGIIGKITSLSANLGYVIEQNERIHAPELAGGALLDLTVYPLNFASMVFGDDIVKVDASCVKIDTGVDGQDNVMLTYRDGKMATLYTTIHAQTDRRGMINGSLGYIEIENINNYESMKVYDLDRKVIASYEAPKQITGYEYEVRAAIRAIREGKTECEEMPHAETIKMMKLMDRIRADFGIVYPFE